MKSSGLCYIRYDFTLVFKLLLLSSVNDIVYLSQVSHIETLGVDDELQHCV